nr:hypothetical protein [Tanacetum cinerariifolium]
MELNSIKDAFDRVTKKQKVSSSKSQETIEQIQEIQQALSGIQAATNSEHSSILTELKAKLKEIAPLGQLEITQKELNVAFSKYIKLLEKNFNPDISKAYRNWATANHENLQKNGSDIELKLHRLQFFEILQHGRTEEALKYIQTHISPFGNQHLPVIQKLMGCLVYVKKLNSSPYSHLLSPNHWAKMAHELVQQFCIIVGESYKSPLGVTIAAGLQGLPTLLKLANVMTGKKQEWQSMKQLPVPVDLDKDFQFHSIFVCPVSRDQASENNPPMLMSCGHVLCKQSITKLTKNNITRPFKCPYCPTEVEMVQCKQLYF